MLRRVLLFVWSERVSGLGETVNLGLAISLIYNMPDTGTTPESKPKEKKCEKENDCGPYSRVQAILLHRQWLTSLERTITTYPLMILV